LDEGKEEEDEILEEKINEAIEAKLNREQE